MRQNMKRILLTALPTAILLAGVHAFAQAPTTVQLPVIQVLSVDTTVSVPDGGGVSLGGINRAVDSSVTRGLPLGKGPLTTNRGLSSVRSGSNMSVHATIIDHQELDAAVLAEAAARRGTRAEDPATLALQQKADYLSRNLARTQPTAPVAASDRQPSVEQIRERNELAAAVRDAEAASFFAKGQAAEAAGKPGIAKIYYQMVARRDQAGLKQQAEARLAALASPGKSLVAK
ncbi:hypothetical protein NA78x_003106 [Anatilimnocola sp. NA78]|uniref:hypothetical protein n=1 Tax=Anatilimnocola sp. NA78 TaxID=3415683 RepID=UPI003CE56BF9